MRRNAHEKEPSFKRQSGKPSNHQLQQRAKAIDDRLTECRVIEGHVGPQGLRDIGASSRSPLRGQRDLPCGGFAHVSGFAPVPHPQVSRHKLPRNPGRKPGRRNKGPLGSAEERSEAQGKASMSEHMEVRVAQRPALREHRREPGAPDARPARTRGGFLLVTSLWPSKEK